MLVLVLTYIRPASGYLLAVLLAHLRLCTLREQNNGNTKKLKNKMRLCLLH
jgi:hypothetical protein